MNTSSFLYPDITLRAPEPEDIDFMFACENDTELWKSGINTGPYSRYQLKKYIAENQNDLYEDKQLRLMIELQTKETVGIIDLFSFSTRHLRAEIGIVISKNYRRKNIASAALSLLETTASQPLVFTSYMHISVKKIFHACNYSKKADTMFHVFFQTGITSGQNTTMCALSKK